MSDNQPPKSKSTEEILREMESISKGIGSSSKAESKSLHQPKFAENINGESGTLKSFFNFFIKVVPEETTAPIKNNSEVRPPILDVNKPIIKNSEVNSISPSQRVGDLVKEGPLPKFSMPEVTTTDLASKSFNEIYTEAKIENPQFSIDELAALLENPAIDKQPINVKVIAVNLALSAKGIVINVPIADAIRRDQALDAYQQMLSERVHTMEATHSVKIQQITKETEEYLKQKQAEIEKLRAEISEIKKQEVDFSLRRSAEEKRLANLISPFVEGKPNPITIAN